MERRYRSVTRIFVRSGAHPARVGGEVPRHSRSGGPAQPTCSGSPRGRTTWARPTTRTTRSGSLAKAKEWGLDAQIETFDVLFPTPKERALEMIEPTRFTAKIAEPAVAVDPTSDAADRAVADLQRLLDRRRRHRAAGLRELRHPGRLRGTGPAGHLGEGRHRDRALRRKSGAASSPRWPASTARWAA